MNEKKVALLCSSKSIRRANERDCDVGTEQPEEHAEATSWRRKKQ